MNRKQVRWTMATTVGLLALGLTAAAVTQAAPRRGRGSNGDRPAARVQAQARQSWADRLDLSDAQKEQLADMRQKAREDATLRRGKLADLEAQLEVAWMADNLDKGKVRSLHDQIQKLRDEGADARLDHRLGMYDVLTPDQRQEMRKMRSWGRGGFGMMGRGQGRMHGGHGMMGRGHGMMRGGRGMMGGGHGMRGHGFGSGQGMMGQGFGGGFGPGQGAGDCPAGGPGLGMGRGFGPGPDAGATPDSGQ